MKDQIKVRGTVWTIRTSGDKVAIQKNNKAEKLKSSNEAVEAAAEIAMSSKNHIQSLKVSRALLTAAIQAKQ